MIKEYIEEKYGFKVHTVYIAEVKRDLGLPMYDAPNAIKDALIHLGIVSINNSFRLLIRIF